MYPAPSDITFGDYGLPYRGQPSIVYRVPFTVATTPTTASSATYFGYGDPDGVDGNVRPPDPTITIDTPGSGASRLELVSDGGDMYRVRVSVDPNQSGAPPPAPAALAPSELEPDCDDDVVRRARRSACWRRSAATTSAIRASDEMTAANFADSMPVTAHVGADDAGHARDRSSSMACCPRPTTGSASARSTVVTTPASSRSRRSRRRRERSGSVDACFVATAAYGSLLANDVEMLRHVRDTMLRTNVLGELGVETYYTFGPALAGARRRERPTARERTVRLAAGGRRVED